MIGGMKALTHNNALVLPGGGARGAYQVGVVKAIAELLPDYPNAVPIFCGTSAGSINAAVLATHADDLSHGVRRLAHFWENLRCEQVFKTGFWTVSGTLIRSLLSLLLGRFGVHPPRYLLDNAPLGQLLEREVRFDRLDALIDQGFLRALSITASAYTTADAHSFYQGHPLINEWARYRRKGVATRMQTAHLLASAALPFLFPAQRIGPQFFGDGGLRMIAPLSPAIHLGADRLLIIGTRDEKPIPEPAEPTPYPSLGELAGYLLDTIFMDTTQADLSRLRRINKTLSLLPPDARQNSSLKRIDYLEIVPSEDVRDITRDYAGEIPWSVRNLLKMIGGWGRDWRLPSYLLFESAYTRALIELGHRDGLARGEEIVNFLLAGEAPARPA